MLSAFCDHTVRLRFISAIILFPLSGSVKLGWLTIVKKIPVSWGLGCVKTKYEECRNVIGMITILRVTVVTTQNYTKILNPNPKVPLTPNFFLLFSKRIYNLVKIKKKELSKSIKSSRNYECLKLWRSGSRPRDRRSGANTLVTSAGEAGFLAFEAIVWSAGFHLKFLAFTSCEVWPQPAKSLKPPRNGIRQYRLGLFDWVRGLWLSVLSRRIASKASKWRQVKARNRKSVRMSVWINLLHIPLR